MAEQAIPSPEEFLPPGGRADERASINVSPREAYELMFKLATDDAFRAEAEADPPGILNRYGISMPHLVEGRPIKLPPKDKLREALAGITAGRQFQITMMPPNAVIYEHFVILLFLAAKHGHEE